MDADVVIASGRTTTQAALQLFDALEPVTVNFMLGRWQGSELMTAHPLDGLLTMLHWYGKEFKSSLHVHPLLFTDSRKKTFAVNTSFIPMAAIRYSGLIPRSHLLYKFFLLLKPLLITNKPKATLQLLNYRDKTSACMRYIDLPIKDIFGKIDENTVLGLMDYEGMEKPYFFILKRVK